MSFDGHEALPPDANVAIRLRGVGKHYFLFKRPADRLLQMIWRNKRFFEDLRSPERYQSRHTPGRDGRCNRAQWRRKIYSVADHRRDTAADERKSRREGAGRPLIELGAGFNPEFTGHDNIVVYGQLLGMDQAEIGRKYDDIVRFADIGNYLNRPVKTYSSGMYARLAFAVAMHVDPSVLIVDEILAVGDAPFQRKCLNRFYEIKERGCTILIVAHDQYLVRSLCDRAIYLKAGRQVAFGPAAEVTALYLADIEPSTPAPIQPEPSVRIAAVAAPSDPAADNAAGATVRAAPSAPAVDTPEPSTAPADPYLGKLFRITTVELVSKAGLPVEVVSCGDTVSLKMAFEALTDDLPGAISFVFNLYRHDGLYVCGTTTLMEGMAPHPCGRSGEVTITFPRLPLLAGTYIWRVAINDHGGLLVHSEAKGVCPFKVVDTFRSVGVVHLERTWSVQIQGCGVERSEIGGNNQSA